jgi:MFS family permease
LRRRERQILPLYLVVFFGFVGYSLMITVFTPMVIGGDELIDTPSLAERSIVLGVLLSAYPLAQFLGAPVIGGLSDRWGRRPVLLVSLVASAGCYGAIALALDLGSLPLLFVSCLLAGFAEANIAIAQSAIADVVAGPDRSRFFGYVYLSSSLAYVVGPLAGGKLADASLASWFGYSTPFYVTAGLILVGVVITALLFRETHEPDSSVRIRLRGAMSSALAAFRAGRLRSLYLGNFALYLAIFGFFRVYPLYLVDRFGMGVSQVSEFIAWVAVPIVIVNLGLLSAVSRRMSPREVSVRFGAVLAAWLAIIVVPDAEWPLWITLGGSATALALCLPSMVAMVSGAVRPDDQGRALGTNQSLQVGAEGTSGLAGGGLAAISTSLPLPVMGVLALLGSALLRREAARRAAARGPGNA